MTAKTTTKTTDTATKTKRPSRAKATVVETTTEPTTAATANPFADLFAGVKDPIVRNATAPATGSGHKGRQRDYAKNPLNIGEEFEWGIQGRAMSFKDTPAELRSALGGNAEAAIATAFEVGSFSPFTQTLDSTVVEAAMTVGRAAIDGVSHEKRVQYKSTNLAAFDEAYNRNDDVSDPYNPVYGRQSVARWALASLGATDVVVSDDDTATVTVDPLAMFFARSGAKNISKPMSAVFQNMNTPQGSANLTLVMDAASDEQKRTLAICMGTYLRAAATAASGELADKLAHAATVAPTIIVNTIHSDNVRASAIAALEVIAK